MKTQHLIAEPKVEEVQNESSNDNVSGSDGESESETSDVSQEDVGFHNDGKIKQRNRTA